MDNTVYVALSRQMTLRREFDLIANNVANVDTTGFKAEALMLATKTERPPGGAFTGSGRPISFVLDNGVARDFGQGPIKPTGAPFDVAITGDGFFQITTADGDRYTRDGRFAMNAEGKLVTQTGDLVAGEGGGDITLDPRLGSPQIAGDGTVSQGGQAVGRIAVMRFTNRGELSKTGEGLYENTSNQQPQQANDAKLSQGMLEGSNVQSIAQITRLIEVSRAYEQTAKLMDQMGDTNSQAVQRLGRVQ